MPGIDSTGSVTTATTSLNETPDTVLAVVTASWDHLVAIAAVLVAQAKVFGRPVGTGLQVCTSQRAAAISVMVFAAMESPESEPFAIVTSAAAVGAAPLTD